jgi:hypothetical protein
MPKLPGIHNPTINRPGNSCMDKCMLDSQHAVTHWSVDFVEHLRSVHFALAALSITLIVVISPSDGRLSRVLTQVTQIEELQHRWINLRQNLLAQATGIIDFRTLGSIYISVDTYEHTPDIDGHASFWFPMRAGSTADDDRIFSGGAPMTAAPSSINKFKSWWTQMNAAGVHVHVIDPGAPNFHCEARIVAPDASVDDREIGPDQNSLACERVIPRGSHSFFPEMQVSEPSYASANDTASASDPRVRVFIEGNAVIPRGFNVRDRASKATVLVRASSDTTEVILSADQVRRHLFESWSTGSFYAAFPELESIPEEFNDIPLDKAISRIADLQPKQEQEVEIVGLRIPVVELARWGTLLLLSVQLYFWLHLHELHSKLEPTSPGRDVPWIGIYTSKAAFTSTLLSGCAAPIYAAISLMIRSVYSAPALTKSPPYSLAIAIAGVIASVGLAGLTAAQLTALRRTSSNEAPDHEQPH